MALRLLPLFPLSVVLLPGTPLPLHVFEDRYKQMMSDILPVQSPFGVVLVKGEGIVNIGCTAAVQSVIERYPDGRLDLIAIGQRPFRIHSVDEEMTYLRAEVEYLDDTGDTQPSAELTGRALSLLEKLRAVEAPSAPPEAAAESALLSFQIGHLIGDVDKRQMLLSTGSEVDRLKFLVSVLPQYTAERETVALAKRLAPRNGHAKHVKEN